MSPPYFRKWQSYEVAPGTRCNNLCGKPAKLQAQSDADVKTVYDIFLRGLKRSQNSDCFGWRNGNKYDYLTFGECQVQILQLAKALRQKTGLQRQGFVGLYSANSPQWMISALACASSSFVLVPLYDTLGSETCKFIINEVLMSVLLVDTVAAARRIVECLHNGANTADSVLKIIVVIGAIGQFDGETIPPEFHEDLKRQFGIKIMPISEFVSEITPDDAQTYMPSPDDLYMVQYTSGTTGNPKGVMLTHANFVANEATIQGLYSNATPSGGYNPEEIYNLVLHYLPLAHSYGQLLALTTIFYGSATAFFSGNIQKLSEDAQIVRPTYLALVPRLMNRVYAKVTLDVKAKGPIASKLFWFAYERKRELYRRGIITRSSIWDKIAFNRLQAKLGGRIKHMMTASAPVAPEVLEFWRVAFGAHLFEAYGQTECTALVTAAFDPDGGNVGHPVTCNMIKLVDVPEMNYFSKDGRGEVWVKGLNVMKGYYKRPELTAETLDADGWLHTGDIGEFGQDGALKLIDRKKHIFKLAQGEYIAPEKIESVYASCPMVGQVYVDGNSLQWFTVAIVVPDAVEAESWALKNSVKFDMAELCKNPDFTQDVLACLLAIGRSRGLNRLEQIRSLYLYPEPFSIDAGLLTPSMKNRRAQLRAKFRSKLDELYKAGPMSIAQTQSISVPPPPTEK